jgi:acetyl esterase/lipase
LVGTALALAVACTSAGTAASATSVLTTAAGTDGAASAAGSCAEPGLRTTVAYRRIAGVPRNATSLDLHAPADACDAPVVVWVHGGGYHHGDKANGMRDKVALFNRQGWILVSVNYRLTRVGDPSSAHYPDHYEDVAAALGWVEDNIADYGGDAGRVALLGHSAGADIVANVAAEPTYLADQGASADLIGCLAPLDTAGFDKPRASTVEGRQWLDALGNNPDYLTDTSATLLLRSGEAVPPPDTLSVYRGNLRRQAVELDYLRATRQAGGETVAVDARSLTHGQVSSRIGAAGDRVMTPPLLRFLRTCFTPPAGA